MLGLQRYTCAKFLIFGVLISISHSQDGGGMFTKLFNSNGASGAYHHQSSKGSSNVHHKRAAPAASSSGHVASARHFSTEPVKQQELVNSDFRTAKHYQVSTAAPKAIARRNDTVAKATSSVGQARGGGWGWEEGNGHSSGGGGGGGGGGAGGWGWASPGWGWGGGGGGMMGYGGIGLNGIIGALSLLGLLGLLLYSLFGRRSTTVILTNASGRRRRDVDDFDDGLDGETLPEIMTRVGKFIESAWTGEDSGKKFEPFQLPLF